MSHFSLIAALPPGSDVESELNRRLERYNENRDVDPRPDYEDGTPENFWWYKSLARDAKAVRENDHSVIRPYNPDLLGWSSAESRETPDEQWAKIKFDAEVFESLPSPITWKALGEAYNRYYCEGHPYTDDSPYLYDPESDRLYKMTTYNPDSKWDYWRIGGRWSRYFPVVSGFDGIAELDSDLITTPLSWEWRDASTEELVAMIGKVEGGPKGLLDLEGLRDEKGREAADKWHKWHAFAADYPPAWGWQAFLKEAEKSSDDPEQVRAAIGQAREVYASQPLVQAYKEHPDYRAFWGSPIDEYSTPLAEYVKKARQEAVPGYALLTLDEEWVAPGEMGWFGMSTDNPEDKAEYKKAANEYIDGLDDDVILVVLDLHI